MEKKWYVVHTYSGYEGKVKLALEKRIEDAKLKRYFGEVIVPQESISEKERLKNPGSRGKGQKKLFPGYIIVEMIMTKETWHLVRKTPKVTGFIGGSAALPRPVPMREILQIKKQLSEGVVLESAAGELEKGINVTITSGPFTNFAGVVDEVRPEKKKVRVLVSIFGRSTPIDLEFNQVERVK